MIVLRKLGITENFYNLIKTSTKTLQLTLHSKVKARIQSLYDQEEKENLHAYRFCPQQWSNTLYHKAREGIKGTQRTMEEKTLTVTQKQGVGCFQRLHNSLNMDTFKMSFNGQMVKQIVEHLYQDYYSTIQRNELLIMRVMWVGMEGTILSEKISESHFSFTWFCLCTNLVMAQSQRRGIDV